MKLTRRWFIGGAASFSALQGCKVITDATGCLRGGKANLKFGVLSDVHIITPNTDKGFCGNTRTFEHALKWFDRQGVHAVMIAGDIVDVGLVSEFQVFADAWFKIFPDDRSRLDGRKVEKLFIYGNHDWEGYNYNYTVFGNSSKSLKDDWISDFGTKKTWQRLLHEEYSPVYRKTIKGYDFIGAHWDGGAGASWTGMHHIKPWFEKNSAMIDPSRPFFYFQHPHPKNTCYGPEAWGRDNGVSTEILSRFPNAFAFSGHSHNTLADERSIWQGAFTSLGTGSLRYGSYFESEVKGGHENGFGGTKDIPNKEKTMDPPRTSLTRNGMIVSVYDDCTVIRRRDFRNDLDIGHDWVVPCPSTDSKPFSFAVRAAKEPVPEFAPGAVITAKHAKILTREAKNAIAKNKTLDADKLKLPAITVSFPSAIAAPRRITWRYNVMALLENGTTAAIKRVLSSQCLKPGTPEDKNYTLSFLKSKLPKSGKVRFSVTPCNCFGNHGKSLTTEPIDLS